MDNIPTPSDKTEIPSNLDNVVEGSDVVTSFASEAQNLQPSRPPTQSRAFDPNQTSRMNYLESDAWIKSQAKGNGGFSSYAPGSEALTDTMIKNRARGGVADPSSTPGAHPSLFVAMKQDAIASNIPSKLSSNSLGQNLSSEKSSRSQDGSQDLQMKSHGSNTDDDYAASHVVNIPPEGYPDEKFHDVNTSQNLLHDPISELSKDSFLAENEPKFHNSIEEGFANRPGEGNRNLPLESSEQPSSGNRNESQELNDLNGIEAFVAEEQVVDALGVSILPTEEEVVEVENKLLRRYLICGIIVMIILSIVIIVPVVLKFGSKSPSQPTVSPTTYPSFSPSSSPTSNRFAEVLNYVQAYSTADTLNNKSSPQFLAADWVANEDPIQAPLGSLSLTQRYLLAVFYFSTGGDNWEDCGRSKACYVGFPWLTGDEIECRWHGVRCTDDGRVNKILIGNQVPLGNNLVGTLPIELVHLSNLSSLVLIEGKIKGTIPSEYGKLSELSTFFVQDNYLTGTIPDEFLRGATSMDMFAVGNNLLSGTIPTSLVSMTVLRDLQLSGNLFNGTIPFALGRLRTTLANLELSENKLQGSIPDVIYNLKNLTQLSLDQNLLTGTISPLIGKMSKLEIVELYENKLTGELPDSLFSLEALKKIRVGGNKLSGTISSKMVFLNDTLTEFMAENTLLTGPFPNALVLSLPYLSILILQGTNLTGSVSEEFCARENLNLTVPTTVICNTTDCCDFQG